MGGSSYGGFELPGVDCSTFEIISYPDLLLIKAKAQSSQIRFVHVIVLPQERRNITRFVKIGSPRTLNCSLRASSPIWASVASLARLVSLAQIGELARRLA